MGSPLQLGAVTVELKARTKAGGGGEEEDPPPRAPRLEEVAALPPLLQGQGLAAAGKRRKKLQKRAGEQKNNPSFWGVDPFSSFSPPPLPHPPTTNSPNCDHFSPPPPPFPGRKNRHQALRHTDGSHAVLRTEVYYFCMKWLKKQLWQ